MLTCIMFLLPCLMLGDTGATETIVQKDMQQLTHTWTVVRATRDGKEIKPAAIGIDTIRIQDHKLEALYKGKAVMTATFRVDPTTNPKKMDWFHPKKGALPLIYDLKEGELRLGLPMIDPSGQHKLERPKDFEAKGPATAVLVLKPKAEKSLPRQAEPSPSKTD